MHSRDETQIEDQYVYLSTAETTPFLVTITDGSGTPYCPPFYLSASNPKEFLIGIGQPTKMFLALNDVNVVVSDKGIILEGTKDFYVSFRMSNFNHAETIISKGRPGIGTSFRLGCLINGGPDDDRNNFVASVMATEDNTSITLSDYDPNVVFTSGSGDITLDSQTFTLNAGQSIVFSGNTDVPANLNGIIGALITSSKPVAVNTGNADGGTVNGRGTDLTLDQIVSASQIGTDYIFIKGNGSDIMETPLIVANENGTEIFINGNPTRSAIIDAGEHYLVASSNYQGTQYNKKHIC